jgi:hypothetical protein
MFNRIEERLASVTRIVDLFQRTPSENHENNDVELVAVNLKNATFLVEGMAVLMTLFLAWLSFLGYSRFKEARNEIRKISNDVKGKLDELKEIQESILKLSNHLNGDLLYTKNGLESIFFIMNEHAASEGHKDTLELIFVKSNICKLYSLDPNDRFIGITALMQQGNRGSVEHLEKILLNVNETKGNKLLAIQAISEISKRVGNLMANKGKHSKD